MDISVVTASKFEQPIKDAPSTISLISRDKIIKYGWLSGNEILSRLPGFSISQDYDRKTVSSRGVYEGWNNNHLLMLIDGVPMNDNMYGTAFTWEITPLVFMRSVEVIRGPGSALYGSNATNGVISYNTLSAKDLKKKAEIRYRVGNQGTHVFDLLTGHETEHVSFVSAFNFYQTNGHNYKSLDASDDEEHTINESRSNYYLFNKIEGKGNLEGFSLQHHEQAWEYTTGHGWLFHVPDQPENMNENRRLISLRYKTPDPSKKFNHEYLMRYQRHGVDWNVRLFPNDFTSGGVNYQYGLTELLNTHTSDIFSRVQWSYGADNKSSILGGVEHSYFFYGGDDLHFSNANLNGDFGPTTGNQFIEVGEYFAFLNRHPMHNLGIYGQYTSPKFGDKFQATLGVRYDFASFMFNDIYYDGPGTPEDEQLSFDKLSPRLSLVYSVNKKLTLKAMAGQAFRTPSPSELFGSNTYLLGSNIRELRPEVITTIEFGSDLQLTQNLNWRFNAFSTKFEDQIAYSVSNFNLSTNLYSLTTIGIENEIHFKVGKLDGFLNHSFVERIDEVIIDPTISESKDKLTWVPQQLGNLGANYSFSQFTLSMQVHCQGSVERRDSDRDASADSKRGASVGSWASLDMRAAYQPFDFLEIGLVGTNLTNTKGKLLKNNLYAFDYQIAGRFILLDIRLML
ncbi:TonB-dependent receptor [Marivirga sp. S37H4]|uniref:TonB-dependent receptor n=2 Tax=Marivirga aurantiaca TaxID=2802615 RepID=A0A935C907_9BACT|nr:TonB-dependent receptor [Marivirga aurantiaca]